MRVALPKESINAEAISESVGPHCCLLFGFHLFANLLEFEFFPSGSFPMEALLSQHLDSAIVRNSTSGLFLFPVP
jgi:hypothetical protein